MSLGDLVARMVAFVRARYPQGVPETDYIPLLALLRRRLSDDEAAAVAAQLAGRGELNIDTADIGSRSPGLLTSCRPRRILTAYSVGWRRSAGPLTPTPSTPTADSFTDPATGRATARGRRSCNCRPPSPR